MNASHAHAVRRHVHAVRRPDPGRRVGWPARPRHPRPRLARGRAARARQRHRRRHPRATHEITVDGDPGAVAQHRRDGHRRLRTPSARRWPTCAARSRSSCPRRTRSASTCTAAAPTRSLAGPASSSRRPPLRGADQPHPVVGPADADLGRARARRHPPQDRVMPVLSALLNYYPHLQALSASSPDLGRHRHRLRLATGRMMFQQLPTAGLPFQFETLVGVSRRSPTTCSPPASSRSSTRSAGTSGPRRTSAPSRTGSATASRDLAELGALAALIHCLVVDLDTRLAAGETLPTMPPWHVQENKWRAARYGLDAIVILDADYNERLVTDDLADLLERLAPTADGSAARRARRRRRHPATRGAVPAPAGGRRGHGRSTCGGGARDGRPRGRLTGRAPRRRVPLHHPGSDRQVEVALRGRAARGRRRRSAPADSAAPVVDDPGEQVRLALLERHDLLLDGVRGDQPVDHDRAGPGRCGAPGPRPAPRPRGSTTGRAGST